MAEGFHTCAAQIDAGAYTGAALEFAFDTAESPFDGASVHGDTKMPVDQGDEFSGGDGGSVPAGFGKCLEDGIIDLVGASRAGPPGNQAGEAVFPESPGGMIEGRPRDAEDPGALACRQACLVDPVAASHSGPGPGPGVRRRDLT